MKKRILPFLCGVLTTTICVSTALAGASYSGRISFDEYDLYLNYHEILSAGESMITANGAKVPSSILYTDEYGGGTYYVPVRVLAHALEMPAKVEEDAILWKINGDLAVNLLETHGNATYGGYIQEVAPICAENGYTILSAAHKAVENYEAELPIKQNKGTTVSITVTNRGSANLVFQLGLTNGDSKVLVPTKVPVGETITRTFRVLTEIDAGMVPYLNIGNAADTFYENDFTVRAIQFNGE